jgi:hypothetical protein
MGAFGFSAAAAGDNGSFLSLNAVLACGYNLVIKILPHR